MVGGGTAAAGCPERARDACGGGTKAGSFTVGRAKHNGQLVNWFAGAIDKVEFREGVLTDAQIAALAQP